MICSRTCNSLLVLQFFRYHKKPVTVVTFLHFWNRPYVLQVSSFVRKEKLLIIVRCRCKNWYQYMFNPYNWKNKNSYNPMQFSDWFRWVWFSLNLKCCIWKESSLHIFFIFRQRLADHLKMHHTPQNKVRHLFEKPMMHISGFPISHPLLRLIINETQYIERIW